MSLRGFLAVSGMLAFSSPAFALIAGGCGTACIHNSGSGTPENFLPYILRQGLLIIAFYISGYIFGRMVQKQKISANFARKMVCLLTFGVSYANSLSVPATGTLFAVILTAAGCGVILLMLATLSAPCRAKSPFLNTVFAAINRPEDAPYTLPWLATEAVATSVVVMAAIPAIGFFADRVMADGRVFYALMLIPVFASGIGDALAEIVGKKWGRHHYKTRSVFGGRTYTRSLEGSAMVFLTAVIVGLCVAAPFDFHLPVFFWKAFILLPLTLTLAEALAPHTWDNPLLYLIGYVTIAFCLL
jgi:dolichol kinase